MAQREGPSQERGDGSTTQHPFRGGSASAPLIAEDAAGSSLSRDLGCSQGHHFGREIK